jgi:hypothetical protein
MKIKIKNSVFTLIPENSEEDSFLRNALHLKVNWVKKMDIELKTNGTPVKKELSLTLGEPESEL